MKNVLYTDSAVTGEAAGLSIGLIMAGSNDLTTIHDIMSYAGETEHEKIIRSLGIGLAMVSYGSEEDADDLIERMSGNKD